jgi:hypothetical protein
MFRGDQVAAWAADPKRGAELGAARGKFTAHMLKTFPALHMIAVDQWIVRPRTDAPGCETYAAWDFVTMKADYFASMKPFGERVTTLEMDTVEAAGRVPDGSLDFVFIDADHTYEGVRDDILAWRGKIRPGGVLCGHDYYGSWPGVIKAVGELGLPVIRGGDVTWMVRM